MPSALLCLYARDENKVFGFYERENSMFCLGNMIIIVVELSRSIGHKIKYVLSENLNKLPPVLFQIHKYLLD